jgi:hypothetical protein
MKEIIIERYDEEKGFIRMPLSKAIKEELKTFEVMLKLYLGSERSIQTRVEHFRRWNTSKDNDVTVRLIIEDNKGKEDAETKKDKA